MQTIICPKCKSSIDLDKIADQKYKSILEEKEKQLKQEQEKQRKQFEKELEEKTIEMRKKAKEFAEKKAQEERKKIEIEMKDMQEQLNKSKQESEKAKQRELDLMKKQRLLEEKEKNIELEMEKKLLKESEKLEKKLKSRQKEEQKLLKEKLKKKAEEEMKEKLEKTKRQQEKIRKKEQEEFRKKELELLKQQSQMKKALDEAKRKAEQGSQQIQGDIQEEDLKQSISRAFPIDEIEDVPTGIKGADLIQTVKDSLGQKAGTIIWESKNTKAWSDDWIMKLKEDKLKIGGSVAILITATMPKDVKNFAIINDVMVCQANLAIPVVSMLRDKLLAISKTQKSLEGKDIKMEMLYNYLSSEEFSSKINMMIDVFSNLRSGIDTERRAMERNWKKREKDLERATFAITGMYGELESLMGKELPGSEKLSLNYGEEE